MTSQQAYRAMYCYVQHYYDRHESQSIRYMLGDMELVADQETSDPGSWGDWTKCLVAACGFPPDSPDGAPTELSRDQAFDATRRFFTQYAAREQGRPDVPRMLAQLETEETVWLRCLESVGA